MEMPQSTMESLRGRLSDDGSLSDRARVLVAEAVGEPDDVVDSSPTGETATTDEHGRAYLTSISVTGFRGIGRRAELDLPPGPGLTLIAGRNGAGKSSFADALEYLLTGDSYRWRGKGSKIWRTGWSNIHHDGDRQVSVTFQIERSADPLEISHEWSGDADLDGGNGHIELGGQRISRSELGWEAALDTYRPFLPYDELESMLAEGPSHLYDALSAVLGLDDLTAVSDRLATRRKVLAASERETKRELNEELLPLLESGDDERSTKCHQALEGRSWDLDAVSDVLVGTDESSDPSSSMARARQLVHLSVPTQDRVDSTIDEFRAALEANQQWVGTDGDRALRTAQLLEQAMEFHDHVGSSDCPVCGQGQLGPEWRATAAEDARELKESASAVSAAAKRVRDTQSSVAELVRVPDLLDGGAAVFPVDVDELRSTWQHFADVEDMDDPAKANHVASVFPELLDEADAVVEAAEIWITEHDDRWKPIAERLAAWLPAARDAVGAKSEVAALKEAETWLTQVSDDLRLERFLPIEQQARSLWTTMRCASNVSLDGMSLVGKATRRRLDLDVSVDGQEGASVAVMSQGELNTLALSLFLPRATLPDSPFGFLVIDDPVQSMDPSRVDGLARALESVSQDRQVVVFTHDDRLPEAVRRLGIAADVIQVQRRANSEIDVTQVQDPVRRYLGDANFLARTRLPPHIQTTVVPLLLRQAIEAAAQRSVRSRRLERGETIPEIDEVLDDCETIEVVGLALLDRRCTAAEVYDSIEQQFGDEAARAVRTCNAGAHQGVTGDLEELAKTAGQFARKLEHV